MKTGYVYKSIGLHVAVILLLLVDLPYFSHAPVEIGQAPIIVDLQDVNLAEMTNLPPKAVLGEEDKPATAPEEKKPQPKWTTEKKEPDIIPEQDEQKNEEPEKDFLDTTPPVPEKPSPKPEPKPKPSPKPQPKPVPKPARKPKPKVEPKKPEPSKTPEKKKEPDKTITNSLKSLEDTLNSMERENAKKASPAVIKKGTEVANMGIEGGTGGSYFSELSITETDAIGSYLRECWNLDPGARGIENMIVEIRAYLNRDGSVRDVQILDKGRLASDPSFRAVAESARRAVWACSNKNGVNIYKVFAEKYPEKYDMWGTILLSFNPMNASIK